MNQLKGHFVSLVYNILLALTKFWGRLAQEPTLFRLLKKYLKICKAFEIYMQGIVHFHISSTSRLLVPRKFKGGICCGGHLGVTYGGALLYREIFFVAKPIK